MTEIAHRDVEVNGLRMRIAEAGEGPLVLLLQYLIPADLTPCYFLTIAITGAAFLMRFHIKKPGLRGVLILVGLGALEFVLILLCEVLIR